MGVRRGCIDNVFTFSSIIQIEFSEGKHLYAAVVDFKKDFDTISHSVLWFKL